jgi:DNA-binding NarL/FixJ family response regulator
MRIVIADDNAPFRTRLAALLSSIGGVEVVGQAEDVPGALETIDRTKPDTVILDIHMPGGSGLDLAQAVKSSHRTTRVIMLTVGPRSEYQSMAYLRGADFFFEKSSDLRKLAKMLKALARNE